MKVTEIKVFPVREEKLKAFVSIVIDSCFMVNDIKVIRGREDLFISMPSRRKKNGKFKDVAHPLNNETRQMIEGLVLGEYRRVIGEESDSGEREAEQPPAPEPRAAQASSPPVEEAAEPDAAADEVAEPVFESEVASAPPEPIAAPEAVAEATSESTEPVTESPGESEDSEDKSLEEVTELHLRDSFWST